MASTLAQYESGRDNNFKLIRLIAAGLVLYSHAYPLTRTPGEPLERLAGFSLGHFGVDVFFVISGYLVTGSLLSRGRLSTFLRARTLRIFPALAANALLTAFVIGALHTSLPLARYFASPGTWAFALGNCTTWPWGVTWELPGVFEHTPLPRVVNGSLWSLPWELTMYAGLAIAGLLVLLPRSPVPRRWLPWMFGAIALAALAGYTVNEALELTDDFTIRQGLRLVALFTTGSVYYELRTKIPLSVGLFVGALALFALALGFGHWLMGGYVLALPYLVLWLSYVPAGPVRAFNRLGDYSYGLYLWAFPLEQALMVHLPGLGQPRLAALAGAATLAAAVLSWHLLEERALKWK